MKDYRTHRTTVRFTDAEATKIAQQAAAVGVTPSEWIRAAAMGKHIRSSVDMEVLNELRRQGGLLKHLYNEGVLDPAASRSALSTLESVAARLIRQG